MEESYTLYNIVRYTLEASQVLIVNIRRKKEKKKSSAEGKEKEPF